MAIEITHLGHTYTYTHPAGWSGGDEQVREKLNEFHPASDYPEEEGEKVAARHALAGILAGGEIVAPESGGHPHQGLAESEVEDTSVSSPGASPDRILEREGDVDRSRSSATDPDRILGETDEDDGSGGASGGDPDKILEG